jgi:CubicO group peptidase (beta-lactamase class C family)
MKKSGLFGIRAKVFSVYLLTWGGLFSTAAHAGSCQDALNGIDRALTATYGSLDASILVQKDDRVLFEKSFGSADRETRFLLASVTKSLVAIATMRVIEEGRLALNESVLPLLPQNFQNAIPASQRSEWQKIKLSHILSHTAGIADYINRDALPGELSPSEFLKTPRTYEAILNVTPKKLLFPVNTDLSYSNTGFLIGGRILSDRVGLSLEDTLKSRVFDVLGMRSTSVAQAGESGFLGTTTIALQNLDGAGNAVSTATDLMRLLRALDFDGIFLSQASIDRIFTPDPACGPGASCIRYGLGFSVRSGLIAGNKMVLHSGTLATVSNMIAKVPALGLNMVVLTNGNGLPNEARVTSTFQSLVANGCI